MIIKHFTRIIRLMAVTTFAIFFAFMPYGFTHLEDIDFSGFESISLLEKNQVEAMAILPYTATDDGINYLSGTSLSRINDGNIATDGVNSYQVHPSNAVGKTITMTFASPVNIESIDFYNRTSCCQNRIDGADMIFKDSSGGTIYTYTFAGTGNFVTITDPAGDILNVKTVELTNFQGNSQNFREIAFNEAEIPAPGGVSTDLTLWLDADDAATLYQEPGCMNLATAGQGVGCWQDKSGQNNHVTGTAEPTVLAASLNGKTTLDFASDSLATPDGDQITSNTGYTKFAVVKFDAGGSNNIISSSPGTHAFWGNGGTQIAMWHSGTFINSGNLGISNYQIGVGRYGTPDGEISIINVDGTEVDTDTATRNFNSTNQVTRIGSHGSGNNLNGQLAEAIVYDRALTDDEIDKVECYLSAKWGIAVSSDCQLQVSVTTLSIPENAGTETFTVELGEQPATDVVVDISSANTAEATVSPATLTFTDTNWNVAQTVTVTGVDDSNRGDDTTTITVSVNDAVSDDNFDAANDVIIDISLLSDEPLVSPGGIAVGLAAWVKADNGILGSPITAWENAAIASDPIIIGTPDFEAESINFNPAVSFQGVTTNEYINFGNIVNGWNEAQAFMVAAQDNENVVNGQETGHWRIGGNSNSHNTWVNELLYESFGNNSRINNITTPTSTHIPHLYSASQSSTNQSNLYWNGENFHTSTRGSLFGNQPVWLGRNRGGGRYLGDIPEFILYDAPLSAGDKNRVDSYLALKYGISLDQSTPTDYIASDGTTQIWDANIPSASTYNHDIAGIGRDDDSGLGQVKSRSMSEDGFVIIEAEAEGTNTANNFTDIDNLEFLTWANDDGNLQISNNEIPTGLPVAANVRLNRQWQVQHHGDLGSVMVSFDLADQPLIDTTSAGDYALLIDTDADFSDAAVHTTGANINGDEIVFSGVSFTDRDYFTLAGPPKPAPGGVGSDLWLKADKGTDTTNDDDPITTWTDQAGNNNAIGSGTTRPLFKNDTASQINFNPTLRFDGINDWLGITRNFPERNYSHLIVYKTSDANGSLSAITSPTSPTARSHDRNFTMSAGQLRHRLWSEQRLVGGSGLNNNKAHIASLTVANGDGQRVYSDGTQVASGNKDFSNFSWQTGMVLGRHNYYGALAGDIAEVIFVDRAINTTERNRVESYLALKYGITLDQSTATNYVSSNGSVIFDASTTMAGYNHDIAGIGQDDTSGLDQTQSLSQNDDAIVRISNASAQDTHEFLVWGNDDGVLTQTTTNIPTTIPDATRLTRLWRAQETGDVGNVDVSIDISSLGIIVGSATNLHLIKDTDTDFTDAPTIAGSSISGGVVTFSGVSFDDGDYFTLAVLPVIINGTVWSDDVNSGVIDSGEVGINNVTVALYNDNGTVGTYESGTDTLVNTATTANNGTYTFAGLPGGDYVVQITDTANILEVAIPTIPSDETRFYSTAVGDVVNNADFGYDFMPPVVTDAHISVNSGTGTNGTFIVGDTLTVTWDASIAGDAQPFTLTSVLADMSDLGGAVNTLMTDTTDCGGTANDGIYETCITYSAGNDDVTNVNVAITATNAGLTTGPITDSSDNDIDNQPPVFISSGLAISPDGAVADVAAVNGNDVDPDQVVVNAVLDISDTDTITWDATAIGGSANEVNGNSITMTPGNVDDLLVTFDVTATDNAGNTIVFNTDTIDNSFISVDTIVPSGLTISSPDDAVKTNMPTVEGICEPEQNITIVPSSDDAVVSAICDTNGTYELLVPLTDKQGIVTLEVFQSDVSGNFDTSLTVDIDTGNSSSNRGGSKRTSREKLLNIFGFGEKENSEIEESINPESVIIETTEPTLGAGEQCPSSQLLTQNLKAPAINGKYNSYTKATVTEAKILQEHMNRLGFNAGVVDGWIGPIGDAAIKRMQTYLGTTPDGYVGPKTRALINNSCGKSVTSTQNPLVDLEPTEAELKTLIKKLKEQISSLLE